MSVAAAAAQRPGATPVDASVEAPVEALIDALGRPVPLAGEAPRIVSLVPSITELLHDLELGDRVVGRTGFCIHPAPAVRAAAKVGGTKDIDLDAVRGLSPTHVIVNIDENRREDFEALSAFVPQVIVTHPVQVEDNLALYHLLGTVFHRGPQAQALGRALRAELDACAPLAASPARPVLYLIWREPWMTVGPDTYVARMLAQVGLQAVAPASPRRYPEVDLGAPDLHPMPEAVLLSSEPYRFRERHCREVAAMPGWQGVPVRLIDGEMVSWYGSRAIQGLRYLRQWRASLDTALGLKPGP